MHLAASRLPILNLGFRPFFTGAAVFSVASMLAWAGMYLFGWLPHATALPTTLWHAHEMIFGFSALTFFKEATVSHSLSSGRATLGFSEK